MDEHMEDRRRDDGQHDRQEPHYDRHDDRRDDQHEDHHDDHGYHGHREEQLLDRLHEAFGGGEGTFLQRLRAEMVWDQAAFAELVNDMRSACELKTDDEFIERWLAYGFWYAPHFVKTWIVHPNFPKDRLAGSHTLAGELLEDLAHWFFTDQCPWEDPDSWIAIALKDSADAPVPPPRPASEPHDAQD